MSSELPEIDDRVRAAWNQVRAYWQELMQGRATREQDPQPELARELFAWYRANPQTPSGAKALENAFVMWGNSGDAAGVDNALAELDVHSDVWPRVLHGTGNAYGRRGRYDDYLALLQSLETRLTHVRSRSALLATLGSQLLH